MGYSFEWIIVWAVFLVEVRLEYIPLGMLQETTTQAGPQWLNNTQKVADIIQKAVTAGALIVGGIWAYYKFVRGRIFVSNLEVVISGEASRQNDRISLVATASVKNIGSSKLEVFHTLTALRILAPKSVSTVRTAEITEWDHLKTLRLFADQTHFEPTEPAVDAHLVVVPGHDEYTALKLEAIVVSDEDKDAPMDKKDAWVAVSIVNLISMEDNNNGGS